DARREFAGAETIRRWVAKEITGDKISIEVREVFDHHGDTIVRGAYDGEFDKTGLPGELILSNYFSVRDGKLVSLIVVNNQPASDGGPTPSPGRGEAGLRGGRRVPRMRWRTVR